jgi:hypothetical protein
LFSHTSLSRSTTNRFIVRTESLLVTFVAFWLITGTLTAAPDADLWPYWQAYNSDSERIIDHGQWATWLNNWADQTKNGIRRVDYGAVDQAGQERLDQYLDHLTSVTVTELNRDVQMAYWINLYNALTVDVVLKHYPVDTIKDIDISPGWFSSGPWDKKLVTIEGKELTLNDIEHRILRPIWQDPRIHYVVNCASLGCPNLAGKPYTANRLDRMLEQAAKQYVNHPRGARVEDGSLIVSRIYSWYMSDFGGTEQQVIEHLKSHANEGLKQQLASQQSIYDYRYDWTLNSFSTPHFVNLCHKGV